MTVCPGMNQVVTIPSRKDIRSFLRIPFIPPPGADHGLTRSIHCYPSLMVNQTMLWMESKIRRGIMMNHKAIENCIHYTYKVNRQNAPLNYDMIVERIYTSIFEHVNGIWIVRTRTPGVTSSWLNQLNENIIFWTKTIQIYFFVPFQILDKGLLKSNLLQRTLNPHLVITSMRFNILKLTTKMTNNKMLTI